ncbi:MAG TPA: biotin/lipoyl-containing protein [Actinophytocola sp.]|nr:biotin/lipoyl-containing protein [Actinophytocola sp.]
MSHRLPRAVTSTDHTDEQTLEEVLAVVRHTAADLLAKSPQPPSTLNVRIGEVAVEMAWQPQQAGAAPVTVDGSVVPLVQAPTTPPAPAGPTLNAATVGTFYRAPAPGAPPFVAEGDEVSPGQQVAIIEAMKLMLPVEAERGGRIAEVLVADGEGVEYGQPLFRLDTDESELAA